MTNKFRTWTLLLLAASLAGCDGEAPSTDAGGNDGGTDAQVETVAPAVTATIPRDGDTEVNPTTSIRIVFSEPVDPSSGTLAVSAGESQLDVGAPSASADGRELTFALSSPLPGNASVEVVVDGYRDPAGNAMAAAHAFSFTTSDPFAPTVVSATPAEGATGATPSSIEIEFSEVMNATLGVVELEGGPGTIGGATWDGARVSYPISGLAPSTAYRVVLRGFADPAGNVFEGEPYLGDGALDFTTTADTTAPVVLETTPTEGQADVPPTRTTRVRVVFSEPMDTESGTATLVSGESSTDLEASWAGGDAILVLDVSALLEEGIDYRVELTGFTDASGNALDGTVYLGDGALDFHTDVDELPPYVVYTNPGPDGSGVRWSTQSLYVTFSEGMDPSITEVPYTDGVSSGTFTGTWSSAGTLFEIDVAGKLISGRSYELDFSGFRDAEDTALDTSQPYLGDGKLRFTTAAPRGENCQDFLTNAEATVSGGVHTWTIEALQVGNVDGAAPCDRSGGSTDAVVRYTKTSPDSTDASGEGRVLRVTVTSSSSDINLDVLADACDPTSSVADRLFCGTEAKPQTIDLDVPPGEYFIWVARSTMPFQGATVTVEELPAGYGDTCKNAIPITAGSTSITPNGTRSLLAPSCTGSQPLTWYRYTAGQRLGIVSLDAPRPIGSMDLTSTEPGFCRTDTVAAPLPIVVEPGREACIAVQSGSATTITIEERPYTGVRGVLTDLNVSYPPLYPGSTSSRSAPAIPIMAVTPTRIYLAANDILYGPRTGGTVAIEYEPPDAHPVPGENGLAIGEVFYSLSTRNADSANPQPAVLKVTDETGTFLDPPVPVDTSFPYVTGPKMSAITVDGSNFLIAQDTSSALPVTHFYSVPIAGGPATHLGSNNILESVAAIAADATYVYVISRTAGGGQAAEGIYRLRRDELANPDATPFLVYGGGHNWPDGTGALYLDSSGDTSWLYFRTYNPAHVHLLVGPDEATPRYLGPIFQQSTNNQIGLAYDASAPALFLIDHDNSKDRWIRMD